jgi:hypothetical protein
VEVVKRVPFVWQSIEHWTGGDLMETLQLINSDDEAADFMEVYTAACDDEEHAEHNIRYMLDIIAHDDDDDSAQAEAERLAELFMVTVPTDSETLSGRNWWSNSSVGLKVEAAA